MNVRAKLVCNEIVKSGDARYPHTRVTLGAVYSGDPESENRSFAQATPTASLTMSIDPNRPAANAFKLGAEYYVDISDAPVADRYYISDKVPAPGEVVELITQPGIVVATAEFVHHGKFKWVIKESGSEPAGTEHDARVLIERGITHWRPRPE